MTAISAKRVSRRWVGMTALLLGVVFAAGIPWQN